MLVSRAVADCSLRILCLSILQQKVWTMTASMKWPPKLDDDNDYESWKEDILMLCDLTNIPEEKQALAIQLALIGQAHPATGQIGRENLKKGGVKVLLEQLDTLYLADKCSRQFAAFTNCIIRDEGRIWR